MDKSFVTRASFVLSKMDDQGTRQSLIQQQMQITGNLFIQRSSISETLP
jgi:hypothetical protein